MIIKCNYCSTLINRYLCEIKKSKRLFCNMQCYRQWMSEYQREINHHCYNKIQVSCGFCGKKILKHPSRVKKYHYVFCNRKCKARWDSKYRRGPLIYNWIIDRSKLKHHFRDTLEGGYQWVQWRKRILVRDKFCMLCGDDKNLVVHHIVKFSKLINEMTYQEHKIFVNKNILPDIFYDIDNGICLCNSCHVYKVNGHEEKYEDLFKLMIYGIIEK